MATKWSYCIYMLHWLHHSYCNGQAPDKLGSYCTLWVRMLYISIVCPKFTLQTWKGLHSARCSRIYFTNTDIYTDRKDACTVLKRTVYSSKKTTMMGRKMHCIFGKIKQVWQFTNCQYYSVLLILMLREIVCFYMQ